ncbi:DUF2778 domain-containing protein [Bradyrhizobium sp. ARR65]|uniref:DUF2778 domain-containing protein n=1 Tax=Bradyrhizobium sp. ARR65 TaxID=1040989 RepID=UPI0004657184|nr:DUF2778 domain-containing protein [Bradyrhizobium sp. ARR65]
MSRVALAGQNRKKSSGKAVSQNLLGGAAIACLVLGCGWTVYSNIISASVYPTLGSAGYDEPIAAKPSEHVAGRSAAQAISEAFASLPTLAQRATSATVAAITPDQFNDRFAASAPTSIASRAAEAAPPSSQVAETSKPVNGPKLAEAAKAKEIAPKQAPKQVAMNVPPPPAPSAVEAKPAKASGVSLRDMAERAKATMMSITSGGRSSMVEKLWGKQPSQGSLLAYASADAGVTASISREQNPMHGGSPPYDRDTAVYDISAHTVYLPDGSRLEAHSGLGSRLDDPSSAPVRMRGVTPPHIYSLKPREALFHGVPALRLTPLGGEGAIYGREGLLAHTYMLGPNGDSNGCVSFRDYYAFLDAYRSKGIRKLAVLARIE